MIPDYLVGKSAAYIVDEMSTRFFNEITTLTGDDAIMEYGKYVKGLLLLAVKDALMNTDGIALCDGDYALMGSEAECRAIVFLNFVLPKE